MLLTLKVLRWKEVSATLGNIFKNLIVDQFAVFDRKTLDKIIGLSRLNRMNINWHISMSMNDKMLNTLIIRITFISD